MFRLFIFILLVIGSSAFVEAANISESQKISYLLQSLETSKVLFIRNGQEHSGAEAKAHLTLKLEKAGTRIQTAEDFITYLGSRSSISGEPYYVELPDGTRIKSGVWLRKKLVEIEAKLNNVN